MQSVCRALFAPQRSLLSRRFFAFARSGGRGGDNGDAEMDENGDPVVYRDPYAMPVPPPPMAPLVSKVCARLCCESV